MHYSLAKLISHSDSIYRGRKSVMVKHCHWGECHSRSTIVSDSSVTFFPFPRPCKYFRCELKDRSLKVIHDRHKCPSCSKASAWMTACNVEGFTELDVLFTRTYYVCSLHFVDGRPSDKNPNPIAAEFSKARNSERQHQKYPKLRRIINSTIVDSDDECDRISENGNLRLKNISNNAPVTRGAGNNGLAGNNEVHSTHGASLPNIRPHPNPPTNSMNYNHGAGMNNHMHQTTIMRLHPQQIASNMNQNMNSNAMSGTVHHQNPPMNLTNLPVHPDVRLSPHPFYEQQENGELMRIKTLMNNNRPFISKGVFEATFPFHLTPQQANMIFENRVEHIVQKRTDFGIQVLVRFCKYDTATEQEDALPIHLSLRCNGTPVPLCNPIPTNKPGMDGRRLGRPINITPQVRVSPTVPNFITVNWHFDPNHHLQGQIYALGVYLVKRLSPKDLMNKLQKKGVKPVEFAKYMIKEKMTSSDAEIMTNKLRTSLRCPLGKMRIETPLRSQKCTHLQCFDAFCYLAMNERRPTWRCPFCDQQATFSELYIDGFFREILNNCESAVSKVEFSEDGAWTGIREDEEEEEGDDHPPPEPRPVAKSSQLPPPPPHQVIAQQQKEQQKDQMPTADDGGGDASVIDLTSDDEEESSSATVKDKNSEKEKLPTKRDLDSADNDSTSAKRMREVPSSPEIICLDSSDDEDEVPRPTSPKAGNSSSGIDAPDSTTAISTTATDSSITSSNPLPMPISDVSGMPDASLTMSESGATASGQCSVYMGNSSTMMNAASGASSYMNSTANPSYAPSTFPANSNGYYPQ